MRTEIGVLPGNAIAFQCDGGDRRIRRGLRQPGQMGAIGILRHRDRRTALEQFGGQHLHLQAADGEIAAGPEMHMHEQGVALAGEIAIGTSTRLADVRVVNRIAAGLNPRAHLGEDSCTFGRNPAVGHRADIEQVIAAVTGAGDQIADNSARVAFQVSSARW